MPSCLLFPVRSQTVPKCPREQCQVRVKDGTYNAEKTVSGESLRASEEEEEEEVAGTDVEAGM